MGTSIYRGHVLVQATADAVNVHVADPNFRYGDGTPVLGKLLASIAVGGIGAATRYIDGILPVDQRQLVLAARALIKATLDGPGEIVTKPDSDKYGRVSWSHDFTVLLQQLEDAADSVGGRP